MVFLPLFPRPKTIIIIYIFISARILGILIHSFHIFLLIKCWLIEYYRKAPSVSEQEGVANSIYLPWR